MRLQWKQRSPLAMVHLIGYSGDWKGGEWNWPTQNCEATYPSEDILDFFCVTDIVIILDVLLQQTECSSALLFFTYINAQGIFLLNNLIFTALKLNLISEQMRKDQTTTTVILNNTIRTVQCQRTKLLQRLF